MFKKIFKKPADFSERQIAVFALAFAIIGGYFIWHSFAATAYYVSPSGSDGSNCSQSTPCASFAKACSIAAGGDTVFINGGSYNGQTIARSNCNPASDVTFKPVPGATVNIKGSITLGEWGSTTAPDHIVIDGAGGTMRARDVNVLFSGIGVPGSFDQVKNMRLIKLNSTSDGQGSASLFLMDVQNFTADGLEISRCCDADAIQLNIRSGGDYIPQNVTLTRLNIHDMYDTCSRVPSSIVNEWNATVGSGGCSGVGYSDCGSTSCLSAQHVDGIHAFGCINCEVSYSRIYSVDPQSVPGPGGSAQGIFFQETNTAGSPNLSGGAAFHNLTFKGNMITCSCATNTFGLSGPGTGVLNGYVKFYYNTVVTPFNDTRGAIYIYDDAPNSRMMQAGTTVEYVGNAWNGITHGNPTSAICNFTANGGSTITPTYSKNLRTQGSCGTDLSGTISVVSNNQTSPDLHMASGSAGMNAGESTICGPGKPVSVDIDGNARPASGCDIGADEFGGGGGDSTPPTVSMTAPTNGATVSGTQTVSATASDNVGVAGVQFQLDGNNLGAEDTSSPYSVSWDTTNVLNGTHSLSAVARDAAGNVTTATSRTVTTSNGSGGCVDSNTSWQNQTISTQSSTFTADFDATPNGNNIDSVAGFSSGAAGAYTDLATIVRFNTSGTIDVRNGGTYASDSSVSYTSGTSYHFKLVINPAAHTYTTYVTPNGSPQVLLGSNYGFRTEQAGTSSLNNFAVIGDTGDHTTCGLLLSAGGSDTTPPTVSVTAPSAGASLRGTNVSVTSDASDNIAVSSVQFKLDGNNLGSADTTAPYSITWNTTSTTNGTHSLTAVATDSSGNSTTSAAVSVSVDNSPPTVSLTAPANGSSLKGSSVTVSSTASDNIGVVGVQFKLDGNNLGAEDTSSPYSVSWDTTGATNGSHALTAVARDAAGNTTTSSTVTVTVDNAAPTVSMTAPANGATVSGSSVTVSATASDNIGIAGVQFKLDGNSQGAEDTTSPYSISWNTTTLANGTHTLSAVARDAAGNTTTASSITVTVNNASPPPPDTTPPSVPANLRSTATTTTSISLAWNASTDTGGSGLNGYNIYRNGSYITTTSLLSYNDTNLSAGTTYTYRVSAIDNAGNESAQSSPLSVDTADNPPSVSLTANPATVNSGQASSLSWSSTNATTCIASGGWSGPKATSGTQSTGNLTSSQTYTITCTGPGGSDVDSASVTVIGAPPPPPPPPPTCGPKGDIDCDKDVDLKDLSILLSRYGSTDASANLDGKGVVDIIDLSILLSNYGK